MNYRTLVNCEQSRRVYRRMRQVLQEFRESGVDSNVDPDVVDSDDAEDMEAECLERRVASLEEENRGLPELV